MPQEYYSNGKLLISGEYAVLDGAKALAMPTKFGQFLQVSKNDSGLLTWKSFDEQDVLWFEGVYQKEHLIEVSSTDNVISEVLLKILVETQKLNPEFLMDSQGFEIETKLSFPRNWGLGSSSTLINNIAQWAKVDAFALLWNAFSGSGYDIACAQNNSPIVYQLINGLPTVEKISTKLPFSNSLFFVFLNKKKNSREAINAYRQRNLDKPALINRINELTSNMVSCSHLEDFKLLMDTHEKILSEALGLSTMKEDLFSDYKGSIKSLGAWGGDFILATGDDKTSSYFMNKGYHTIIPYHQMIL